MAYSSTVSAGDDALATQYNNLRKDVIIDSTQSATVTYNSDGTIATIADNSVTITISYNGDGTINTYGDGTNTWTISYNANGTVNTVVKS